MFCNPGRPDIRAAFAERHHLRASREPHLCRLLGKRCDRHALFCWGLINKN